MPKKSGSSKSSQGIVKKSAAAKAHVPISKIQEINAARKAKHGRATRTTQSYTGHLKRVAGHFGQPTHGNITNWPVPEAGTSGDRDTISDDYSKPEFKQAFDGQPMEFSDKALALYLSYECFYCDLSMSTCNGIYSAFKRYWKEL